LRILDAQEQTDATAKLVSDHTRLLVAISPGQEQPGLASHRSDDDPALRASIVCERRRVFH
jgi:hypothetical protein